MQSLDHWRVRALDGWVFPITLLIGLLIEGFAYRYDLWMYRRRRYLVFNIFVAFTLVHGALGYFHVSYFVTPTIASSVLVIVVGSTLGVLYELANEHLFRLFDFGEKGVLFLKSKNQIIFGVGIGWGAVSFTASHLYWGLFSPM